MFDQNATEGFMRINYFSDIHLEFGDLKLPETDADVIIAAGDIGIYTQGVEWLGQSDKPVVYIAGNHEFYHHEIYQTSAAIRDASAGTKVHYLDNERVEIAGVRFLGTTLWTALGDFDGIDPENLSQAVNDFRKISYMGESLNANYYQRMHREARRWLVSELEKPFEGKTVVVSHHAPTAWSWSGARQALLRYAYCNEMRELMHRYSIVAWFHGHTHNVLDYRCSGTQVVCNPRGYNGKGLVGEFDPERILEI